MEIHCFVKLSALIGLIFSQSLWFFFNAFLSAFGIRSTYSHVKEGLNVFFSDNVEEYEKYKETLVRVVKKRRLS